MMTGKKSKSRGESRAFNFGKCLVKDRNDLALCVVWKFYGLFGLAIRYNCSSVGSIEISTMVACRLILSLLRIFPRLSAPCCGKLGRRQRCRWGRWPPVQA